MTRGRCGSLVHIRMNFAFTTPRRFSRRTGDQTMKLRDPIASAQTMSRSILRLNVAEESRNNGPSLAQTRERAFEIHIERGGIHGCDLDDWLLAERELQEKYNKSNDGRLKKK